MYFSDTAGFFHPRTIKSIKTFKKYCVFALQESGEEENASFFQDSLLYVKTETILLEEGEFFYDQIIGLSVITTDGLLVGKVEDILDTGSNDVYIVKHEGKEYLIPAIKKVVKKIDIANKQIIIQVMEGLLD